MKKAEAISILATSVRPREVKDRARYDEAVKMAIEALKCSETPKSSERTSETAQADHIADIGKKVSISCAHENDPISRQMAIDTIMGQPPEPHYPSWYAAQIEKLPAVQPATSCSEIPNSSTDCISRQAAIDAALEDVSDKRTHEFNAGAIRAANRMKSLPSAQPEPHKGHWIGGDGSYICSECNSSPMDFIETMGSSFDAYVETLMNFCPNCGADMRGGEKK